jgi:hypothetical protein
MRAAFFLIVATVVAAPLAAQSMGAMKTLSGRKPTEIVLTVRDARRTALGTFEVDTSKAPSAVMTLKEESGGAGNRNPYVGAQVGYLFGGGSFASNVIANGAVAYTVIDDSTQVGASKGWRAFVLPVRGNFTSLSPQAKADETKKKLDELASSASGIRVSIDPELWMPPWSKYVRAGLVGSAGWKLNAVKDTADTTHHIAQGRLSGGGQLSIGPRDGSRLPVILTASYVYTAYADRTYLTVVPGAEKKRKAGEFTIVIPVATSTGLLTELIAEKKQLPAWRMGFVYAAQSK